AGGRCSLRPPAASACRANAISSTRARTSRPPAATSAGWSTASATIRSACSPPTTRAKAPSTASAACRRSPRRATTCSGSSACWDSRCCWTRRRRPRSPPPPPRWPAWPAPGRRFRAGLELYRSGESPPVSGNSLVVSQHLRLAAELAVGLGLEHRAVVHLAAIDVQRQGDAAGIDVGQDVVLERRDERPRRTGPRPHAASLLEPAEPAGGFLEELVAPHLELAFAHPYDAPDAR